MCNCNKNKLDVHLSVIKQLFILHRKIVDLVLTEIHNDQLSRTEVLILFLLRKKEYKITSLAKEIGVPSSTLTGIVDRLIEKGYIERYRSNEDRRVVIIRLHPQVKERVEQANKRIQKLLEMKEDDLPKEWWIQMHREIEKLDKVLDEISQSIK